MRSLVAKDLKDLGMGHTDAIINIEQKTDEPILVLQ